MSHSWMPLYVGDYLRDTRRLSTLQHGIYVLLIMDYWSAGSLPDDDVQLARIAGVTMKQWECNRNTIASLFLPNWKHKRVEEELAKADDISSKRKANADKRWSKSNANAGAIDDANGMHRAPVPQSQSQPHSLSDLPNGKSSAPNGAAGPTEEPKEKPKRQKPDDDPTLNAMLAEYDDVARSLGLPQTRGITSKREGLLRARAHDLVQVFGFPDPLIGMRAVMAKIRASPFLCDRRNRWMGLDWILNETNFLKIMEGTYEKGDASNGFSLHP